MNKSKEFQQLIELVDIITKYKVRQIEIVSKPKSGEEEQSRYWELYSAIAEGKLLNDSDAAAFFQLDEKDRKFKRLKKGLIDRLVNTIFFVDVSDNSNFAEHSAFYECMKEYAAMKILYTRGARVAAFEMAKHLLKKSLQYEFSEIIAGTAQILKSFYMRSAKEQGKFEATNQLALQYSEKHKNEILIQGLYNKLMMPFANSKSTNPETKDLADEYIKILESISENHRSRIFMVYFYLIKVAREMTANLWTNTIIHCNEALEYFEKRGFQKEKRSFLLQKSMAEIMLGDYEDAEQSTDACLALTNAGSGNWFKLQEVKMMLFFHSGRYSEAFQLNRKIFKNPRFDSVSPADQETWKLFDAYLYLLDSVGQVKHKLISSGKSKKFRISKLMNDVPLFSKDKRGMNIPVIILHFLFLLKEGKFDEADRRVEAIMKYYQRHLKASDDNYRTNCFLKMIESLAKSGFMLKTALPKAEKWKTELEKTKINLLNQTHEIEVVPYGVLWQIALECLEEGNQI